MKRLARNRSRAKLAGLAIVGTTFGTLVACADSTILGQETVPEGGTTVPSLDSGVAEAEAAVEIPDAPAPDATIPVCSTDGFCHTVVPVGVSLIGVWSDGVGVTWALSGDGDVFRWDGLAWNIHYRTGTSGTSIWGSGPTDVWVVSGGEIFHGTGASPASLLFTKVQELPGDPSVPITSLWGAGPDDIWAVGGYADLNEFGAFSGRALHFGGSDAGTGWTIDDDLSSRGIAFHRVWGSPTAGVWMSGLAYEDWASSIQLLRRPPGASDWTDMRDPMVHGLAIELHGAALSSDSSVFLSGVSGVYEESRNTMWRGTSTDDGATFTWTFALPPSWMRRFFAFWVTGPDDTWGIGENGLVSHWDGTTWTQAVVRVADAPVGRTLRAIWGNSNDDFWVVGDEIALHKTTAGKP